jgi:hypothetical protein
VTVMAEIDGLYCIMVQARRSCEPWQKARLFFVPQVYWTRSEAEASLHLIDVFKLLDETLGAERSSFSKVSASVEKMAVVRRRVSLMEEAA